MYDVWIEVLQRLRDFDYEPERGQFESWLYAVVRSKAVDLVRFTQSHPVESLTDEAALQFAMNHSAEAPAVDHQHAAQAAMHRAILELPHAVTTISYAIFKMRWLKGRPLDAIAKRMHLTRDEVRWRDHRTRRRLRELFERDWDDCSESDE